MAIAPLEVVDVDRMKELVYKLNAYAYHYYVLDDPIISDKEYDQLYDEVVALEKQTGKTLKRFAYASRWRRAYSQIWNATNI